MNCIFCGKPIKRSTTNSYNAKYVHLGVAAGSDDYYTCWYANKRGGIDRDVFTSRISDHIAFLLATPRTDLEVWSYANKRNNQWERKDIPSAIGLTSDQMWALLEGSLDNPIDVDMLPISERKKYLT